MSAHGTALRAVWPLRAGLGLARSTVLAAVTLLFPAVWALLVWVVWLADVDGGSGHGWWQWGTIELALIGAWACLVLPVGVIGRVLRALTGRFTGTTIQDGYRPTPALVLMSTGYWWTGLHYWRSRTRARISQWLARRSRDPAAWRDVGALALAPFTAGPVAALPPAGVAAGVVLFLQPAGLLRAAAIVPAAFGVATAPYAWRIAAAILARLLSPSPAAALSERVAQLTAQRADTTAAQAAEIRRIERNLHDGAQARLVALGMTLATAQRALGDPDRVQALLAEAKSTTTAALHDLRELVRGINPPVLTERGLADAVRALALDSPLEVHVDTGSAPSSRPGAPVESALYFGAAELVTNALKHAGAARVWIRVAAAQTGGIELEVVDDGRGGATETAGGGLAGLRRRLAVFDGSLTIDSPAGGPTRVRMAVPWTSS